ncbi:MAG TPA: 1-deoxy-D-xylulose-5-phosphate synthase [Actinomycetota bacterium]
MKTGLARLAGPADLKDMTLPALQALAEEIRTFLVEKVSRVGGHLGPNLGVVELTIVLHRVFESPRDVLLFDTGHQAYVHKILTGRAAEFDSLRQPGGLSGYPSRAESAHDVVESSHASAALSYADGLAKAFQMRGQHFRRVVALVGDGALTGGMRWEALNNIGAAPDRPVIIVLNDNRRSYAPTIGALARHLEGLRRFHDDLLHDGTVEPGTNLFEDLGLTYIGPVDGHDISALEIALRRAKRLCRPAVVHCITIKGKGYLPAERDPIDCLHAVDVIDPATGRSRHPASRTWTSVFADEIVRIGAERDDVVCVSAGMVHPVGLGPFAERFPDRIFDVGIAEQHAVTSAAGLALGGLRPVVAIYATFLGRAWDQILMDVALHRLPVTFVTDRAGVTGPDGPSHHGMWDGSILPVVPGIQVAAPRDPGSLRELLREALGVTAGPTVIRYPKSAVGADIPALGRVGQCDILRHERGARVLLVAVGPMAVPCLEAAEELGAHRDVAVSVVDPRWIAPLDAALLEIASSFRLVLTVEDGTTTGALGSRIAQALAATGASTCAATFALPPRFLPHGSRDQILRAHGLDAAGIATTVLKRIAKGA